MIFVRIPNRVGQMLMNRLAEGLAGPEGQRFRGSDSDAVPGPRILPQARRLVLGRKCSQAGSGDQVAFLMTGPKGLEQASGRTL